MDDALAGQARTALSLWLDVTAQSMRVDGPDLTARQTAILLTIYLEPGPHTVRGLAAHLGLGKPAVVRALDTMAAAGLVRRVPDPADRRSVFLEPTEAGGERLADFAGLIARQAARLTQIAAPGLTFPREAANQPGRAAG